MNSKSLSLPAEQLEQQQFIVKVYAWMGVALAITAGIGMYLAGVPELALFFVGNRLVFFGLIIVELLLVASLVGWVAKMSSAMATLIFLGYAALNGLTLSVVFMAFTTGSIASTFFITAGTFAVMSMYGFLTRQDLTSWGNLLFMGLIGVVLATLVNIFWHNETLYWITTYIGIFIFVGLVAYDTQKIKALNILGNAGTEEDRKEAIIGALVLYLDFINLFLMLLRILGRRK